MKRRLIQHVQIGKIIAKRWMIITSTMAFAVLLITIGLFSFRYHIAKR